MADENPLQAPSRFFSRYWSSMTKSWNSHDKTLTDFSEKVSKALSDAADAISSLSVSVGHGVKSKRAAAAAAAPPGGPTPDESSGSTAYGVLGGGLGTTALRMAMRFGRGAGPLALLGALSWLKHEQATGNPHRAAIQRFIDSTFGTNLEAAQQEQDEIDSLRAKGYEVKPKAPEVDESKAKELEGEVTFQAQKMRFDARKIIIRERQPETMPGAASGGLMGASQNPAAPKTWWQRFWGSMGTQNIGAPVFGHGPAQQPTMSAPPSQAVPQMSAPPVTGATPPASAPQAPEPQAPPPAQDQPPSSTPQQPPAQPPPSPPQSPGPPVMSTPTMANQSTPTGAPPVNGPLSTRGYTGDSIMVGIANSGKLNNFAGAHQSFRSMADMGFAQARANPNLTALGAMPSGWISQHARPADIGVISSSTNDVKPHTPVFGGELNNPTQTMQNLTDTAGKYKARIWVKPVLPGPRAAVEEMLRRNPGDKFIDLRNYRTDKYGHVFGKEAEKAAADINRLADELQREAAQQRQQQDRLEPTQQSPIGPTIQDPMQTVPSSLSPGMDPNLSSPEPPQSNLEQPKIESKERPESVYSPPSPAPKAPSFSKYETSSGGEQSGKDSDEPSFSEQLGTTND